MRVPSGLNAALVTEPVSPPQRGERAAGLGVPHVRGVVGEMR